MKLFFESYFRALLATLLTAVVAVGKLPFEFSSLDWLVVANAVWVAALPPLIRFLNPNDTAFGVTKLNNKESK